MPTEAAHFPLGNVKYSANLMSASFSCLWKVWWSHVSEHFSYHSWWTRRSRWSSGTCRTLKGNANTHIIHSLTHWCITMSTDHTYKVKWAVNLQCGRGVQVVPEVLGHRDHPGKVTDWPLEIFRVTLTMIYIHSCFGFVCTDYRCALLS